MADDGHMPLEAARELDAVKRFPERNPNPVLPIDRATTYFLGDPIVTA